MSCNNTDQSIKLTTGITNTTETTDYVDSTNSLDLVDLEEEYSKYYQQKENDIEWASQVLAIKFKKLDELYSNIDSIKSQIHQLKNRLFMINFQLDQTNDKLSLGKDQSDDKERLRLLHFYQITNDKIIKLNQQVSEYMEVITNKIPMNARELSLYKTKKQKFELNITKSEYSRLYYGLIGYMHNFPEKIKNSVIVDLMIQLSEFKESCNFLPETDDNLIPAIKTLSVTTVEPESTNVELVES